MTDLEPYQRDRLATLEGVIERGLTTFVEVGEALLEIRTSRLYLASHTSFEAYCRERWGMSKTHANRTIEAASVVGLLTPNGVTPRSEAVARELAPLKRDPEAMQKTWAEVVATHPAPTAADVRRFLATEDEPAPQAVQPVDPYPEEWYRARDGLGSFEAATYRLGEVLDRYTDKEVVAGFAQQADTDDEDEVFQRIDDILFRAKEIMLAAHQVRERRRRAAKKGKAIGHLGGTGVVLYKEDPA